MRCAGRRSESLKLLRSIKGLHGVSAVAERHCPVIAHLNRQLELLPAYELWPLHRHDASFNSKLTEGCIKFLNQGLLHLGFGVYDLANQALPKAADKVALIWENAC